ncbi:fungal-specific transcription factor domain-containing protein [Aspergillus pseudotamarii]|uniref:Fungal-specific transcription factor domain-containing protein n=1 Tax=Aspergillus pseudotamarii TaxID=132259 RepID=A0A5N6T6H6_ASPPS|nr:fungal-specific transcription factor domain-containing protein [Aspergillus pseudotamarii]KAE8141839.1 fungal-specific transcription factor domain-containing protein [Aspergillus pseudotamarii]
MSFERNTPPPKRKRTTHACDSCRQRKSRCNGARPMCDVCLGMGFECHYQDPAKRRGGAANTQASSPLEARLDAMEDLIQQLLSKSNQGQLPDTPWTASAGIAETQMPEAPRMEKRRYNTDSVDGMCAITFAGEYVPGYFGPTSSSAFFSKIINATREIHSGAEPTARPAPGISRPPSPPAESTPEGQTEESTANGLANPFYLPPGQEVMRLVEIFFANTGRLFPYIHTATIVGFNTISRPVDPSRVNRAHLCVLNMIMAFAFIHSPSTSSSIVDKLSQGNVFFARALYMLGTMRSMDATLESVQATLLVAQYVQGTQRSAQTWSLASSAIQGAFQIGLWRQPTVDGLEMGQLEAEVRKRTWWMCYMIDKMCSMTFGRPPLIPCSYMDCELPLDVPLESLAIDLERKSARGVASTVSGARLYRETSKLNIILGQVIENLYGSNLERRSPDSLSKKLHDVIDIDQHLAKWKSGLPTGLEILNRFNIIKLALDSSSELLRFRAVVSLRYHSLNTLLHRKVLEWLLEYPGSMLSGSDVTEFLQTVVKGSINTCSQSARDTIFVIASIADHHILLPIWWYSVYYGRKSLT